jgi:hypothetical protein
MHEFFFIRKKCGNVEEMDIFQKSEKSMKDAYNEIQNANPNCIVNPMPYGSTLISKAQTNDVLENPTYYNCSNVKEYYIPLVPKNIHRQSFKEMVTKINKQLCL